MGSWKKANNRRKRKAEIAASGQVMVAHVGECEWFKLPERHEWHTFDPLYSTDGTSVMVDGLVMVFVQ